MSAAPVAAPPAVPKWWRDAEYVMGKRVDGFVPRPQQAELVAVMAEVFGRKGHAAVEAKVGTGKSYGALMVAEMLPGRTVISTATRALQQQYRTRDVPTLRELGLLTEDVVILDGRQNYICVKRAKGAMNSKGVSEAGKAILRRLLKAGVGDGRRDQLTVAVPDWLWDQVKSDADACRAAECKPGRCAYATVRDDARRAGIVIVNHHVLLADASIKAGSPVAWGRRSPADGERERLAVLGPYRHLIVDEAHALESAAESFGERRASIRGVQALATRIQRFGATGAVNMLAECAAEMQAAMEGLPEGCLIEPLGEEHGSGLLPAADWAKRAAREVKEHGTDTFDDAVAGEVLAEMCSGLSSRLKAIDEALRTGSDDIGPRAPSHFEGTLVSQLVEAGGWLRENLWNHVPAVLMSGTLSATGRPTFVVERLGLGSAPVTLLGSVFDLRRQRKVYVTPRADAGGGARCGEDDAKELLQLLEASDGRALVLFPAMQDLRWMHDRIKGEVPHTLLGQGVTLAEEQPRKPKPGERVTMSNARLAELFHADTNSVLLATRSFFEGVDFPGDTCSVVVIARFPNLRPDDPLTLARRNLIERDGGNPWMQYQEPMMQLLFTQAAGRAIRRADDRGVVAVLDPRSGSKQYAKRALLGLKPSDYTDSMTDVRVFLDGGGLW